MANKDKPENKSTGETTSRDFEQEYLDSKLKLNKRVLKRKSQPNKLELDLANQKSFEEN
jgi:hypothetical protein